MNALHPGGPGNHTIFTDEERDFVSNATKMRAFLMTAGALLVGVWLGNRR